ncbi:hypothetical protein [Kitasatospora sp. NPDC093102]|uniref:hypothetical protein n=1 Tax=Kitasatospora sp. NPDC093102 TaxID=3155069 RepID=UPI003439F646
MASDRDITGIDDISGEERRERGQTEDGLERAERDQFTEDPPQEAQKQVGFLLGLLKGGTRALAPAWVSRSAPSSTTARADEDLGKRPGAFRGSRRKAMSAP